MARSRKIKFIPYGSRLQLWNLDSRPMESNQPRISVSDAAFLIGRFQDIANSTQ
jgi:hypothetical protein